MSPPTTCTPSWRVAGWTASGDSTTPAIRGITDDLAERSGLAKLSGKQTGRADTQGKTGWQTVRLVDVDYANPQLRDYCCREISAACSAAAP